MAPARPSQYLPTAIWLTPTSTPAGSAIEDIGRAKADASPLPFRHTAICPVRRMAPVGLANRRSKLDGLSTLANRRPSRNDGQSSVEGTSVPVWTTEMSDSSQPNAVAASCRVGEVLSDAAGHLFAAADRIRDGRDSPGCGQSIGERQAAEPPRRGHHRESPIGSTDGKRIANRCRHESENRACSLPARGWAGAFFTTTRSNHQSKSKCTVYEAVG